MRPAGHGGTIAAALPLALLCVMASPAAAMHRHCPDCDFPDIPYQWDDGERPPLATPYPQGFVLTVPIAPGQPAQAPGPTLDRYAEVGAALGHCLSAELAPADARWADLTLRVSFRRDGAVNGIPRVAHVSAPADAASVDAGASTRALAALSRCMPLPFSLSLGRAIAGQIFAIRFIQQRNS